jgi:hypothetical protein
MNTAVLERLRASAAESNREARKRWDRSGAPGRKSSPVRDGLKQMLGTGISHAEAARRIGCTPGAVSNMLRREGWRL